MQEFRQLLDDNLELLAKLRDLIVDWVQEGFQGFFQKLDELFLALCGRGYIANPDSSVIDAIQVDKVQTGLVLVLAQLSVFIEQIAIPKIMEVELMPYLLFSVLHALNDKILLYVVLIMASFITVK